MRDSDALARFTIGVALVLNDIDHVWSTNAQLDIMAGIGNTMYDGIAYWKHRSGREINSTFAYVPIRTVLWPTTNPARRSRLWM
jgi:hypothetical protein